MQTSSLEVAGFRFLSSPPILTAETRDRGTNYFFDPLKNETFKEKKLGSDRVETKINGIRHLMPLSKVQTKHDANIGRPGENVFRTLPRAFEISIITR